jgi:hypothetical protein
VGKGASLSVTMLRDPVARVVSAWFYRCHSPNRDCYNVRGKFCQVGGRRGEGEGGGGGSQAHPSEMNGCLSAAGSRRVQAEAGKRWFGAGGGAAIEHQEVLLRRERGIEHQEVLLRRERERSERKKVLFCGGSGQAMRLEGTQRTMGLSTKKVSCGGSASEASERRCSSVAGAGKR